MQSQHIESIDYLRGILALCIAVYHYLSWSHLISIDSNHFLFRVALYGVSMFFIISGFSLAYTYKNTNFLKRIQVINYFRRRIARIYPLFFLVIVWAIMINYREVGSIKDFLIQSFILFRLFDVSGLTPGAWSIGIEVVLYIIFPFLMYMSTLVFRYSKYLFFITSLLIIGYILQLSMFENNYYAKMGYAYFKVYVANMYNHIYFFLFGVVVALLYEKLFSIQLFKKYYLFIMGICIVLFYSIHVNDSEFYYILYRWDRLIFSLLTFLTFISFLFFTFRNKLLAFFGKISYTLYLTHPLSFYVLNKHFVISDMPSIAFVLLFAISLSTIIYYYYEDPCKTIINNLRIY